MAKYVWQLLLDYAHEFEAKNRALFTDEAWDRLKRLEVDIQAIFQKDTQELRDAYNHELALKQAHGDGWRTRIELGDIDAWASVEALDRWNEAANRNPHQWNTDLYREWRGGFIENDLVRNYNRVVYGDDSERLVNPIDAIAALEAEATRLRMRLEQAEAALTKALDSATIVLKQSAGETHPLGSTPRLALISLAFIAMDAKQVLTGENVWAKAFGEVFEHVVTHAASAGDSTQQGEKNSEDSGN